MDLQLSIQNFKEIQEYDELPIPEPPSSGDIERADECALKLCGQKLPTLIHHLWTTLPTIGADGTEIYPPTEVTDEHGWTAGLIDANEGYPPPAGMVHVGRRDDDQISWRGSDGHVFLTDVYSNRPMEVAETLEEYFDETIGASLARTVIVLAKHPKDK